MKNLARLYQECLPKIRLVLQDEKKRVNLLLGIGLAGLMLLAFSEWIPEQNTSAIPEKQTTAEEPSDYALQLQNRLQALIAQVEGVGAVDVMVTLSSGEENVYATDRQTQADGSLSINHVLQGNGGLVETVQTPCVLGVAVVCEGGGEAAVQNRVISLVEALTGVGANHITVAQMAATN